MPPDAQDFPRVLDVDETVAVKAFLHLLRHELARTLSLVNLGPEVVKAVFDGTAPESLTLRKVMYGFPDDWEEQKRVFDLR